MATRRHAREAETAKRARHWHHAKWIAINVALIAFTGWLYAEYLIPRFIVGETSATRVGTDTWIGDGGQERSAGGRSDTAASRDRQQQPVAASAPMPKPDQERRRPRREPQREREYFDAESLRQIEAECIAGTVVRRKIVNGVQEITNIPGAYCR